MRLTRILFIGNSFTNRNDLPGILARLGAANPPQRVETGRVIANGRALKTHWERGAAREAIRSSKWNYVVLQEQSTLPLKDPARMHEYVRLFDEEIKASGAKTVLYMTWARRHQWERQSDLSEAYTSIGRSIRAMVVPVGMAWQRLLSERPDLVLHDKDHSHPNFAGTYLAACVSFAALFTRAPKACRPAIWQRWSGLARYSGGAATSSMADCQSAVKRERLMRVSLIFALICWLWHAGPAAAVVLVKEGRPNATIIVAKPALKPSKDDPPSLLYPIRASSLREIVCHERTGPAILAEHYMQTYTCTCILPRFFSRRGRRAARRISNARFYLP